MQLATKNFSEFLEDMSKESLQFRDFAKSFFDVLSSSSEMTVAGVKFESFHEEQLSITGRVSRRPTSSQTRRKSALATTSAYVPLASVYESIPQVNAISPASIILKLKSSISLLNVVGEIVNTSENVRLGLLCSPELLLALSKFSRIFIQMHEVIFQKCSD
jgi:hypothetical protein